MIYNDLFFILTYKWFGPICNFSRKMKKEDDWFTAAKNTEMIKIDMNLKLGRWYRNRCY